MVLPSVPCWVSQRHRVDHDSRLYVFNGCLWTGDEYALFCFSWPQFELQKEGGYAGLETKFDSLPDLYNVLSELKKSNPSVIDGQFINDIRDAMLQRETSAS